MTADSDIITEAKNQLRLNGTSMDAIALQRLNRLHKSYCAKNDWPQLMVRNATVTTVAGTGEYNLPADFLRMAGERIDYNVTAVTGGYAYNGWPITIVPPEQSWDFASQQAVGTIADPYFAKVTGGGAGGVFKLALLPGFTSGGKLVLFSYYRVATTLTGSGTSIDVDPLADTLIAALAKALVRYDGTRSALEEAAYFAEQERAAYREALRTLYSY